jgi:hypothetical protein
MHEQMMKRSPEERDRIARLTMPPSGRSASLSHDDVRRLASEPLQQILVPAIQAMVPVFLGMEVTVLATDDRLGYITSDAPCVVFDPER